MKKRVLVTGANGLLGQKLTDLYRANPQVEYFASSRGSNRHPETEGYTYITMDIGAEDDVRHILRDLRPNALIHTAAQTQVDLCETEKEQCDLLNTESLRFICDAIGPFHSHLIHLSTDFIFDGTSGPYNEGDEPNPLSYYGWSKLRAEKIVQEYVGPWAIARTILVYGLVAGMSRSNIVLWALSALRDKKAIQVVDDQFRMPTLAEDLAKGCQLIEAQNASGIFHLSGPDYMNIYDLVMRVAAVAGLDASNVSRANSSSFTQPAKRPPRTGFDLSHSRQSLGYHPRSFEDGIRLVLAQEEKA